MTRLGWLFLLVAAIRMMPCRPAAAGVAVCGNGGVEADEECDDGGTCIGGANAGSACTSESQCQGNGVCVGGTKPERACADDSACPSGRCVHCRTFGGDGCAANCTAEREVTMPFVPGLLSGSEIVAGTSGEVVYGDILTIPLEVDGQQVFRVGREKNGLIPVVLRADSLDVERIVPIDFACACLRGVAYKTCGGTLYETDGATPSTNCTEGYGGGGAAACSGKNPCTATFGAGNWSQGIIGCNGLTPADYAILEDNGGSSGHASPAVFFWHDMGSPGSAVLFGATALGTVVGHCFGSSPDYGPDGEFCTSDDPLSSRGIALVAPLTTGSVFAELRNANGLDGNDVGPFSLSGAPFSCSDLANGDAWGVRLVGASTALNQPTVGDIIITSSFVSQPGPSSTPSPTPTPLIFPCVADCNSDGETTVDEIVRLVNLVLAGDASELACPGAAPWCTSTQLTITCIVTAVDEALRGCLLAMPSPTPTCVPVPPLAPTFTFTLDPSVPRAGDHARVSIRISGGAPNGTYNLSDSSGVVEVVGPTYTAPSGSEVDFELDATHSGTAALVLKVFYTIDLPGLIYCYDSRYQYVQSDPFLVTVAPAISPTPTPTPTEFVPGCCSYRLSSTGGDVCHSLSPTDPSISIGECLSVGGTVYPVAYLCDTALGECVLPTATPPPPPPPTPSATNSPRFTPTATCACTNTPTHTNTPATPMRTPTASPTESSAICCQVLGIPPSCLMLPFPGGIDACRSQKGGEPHPVPPYSCNGGTGVCEIAPTVPRPG